MKKIFNILLIVLVVVGLCTLTVYAQQDIDKRGSGFVDVNNDGKCDNKENGKCQKYVDNDNDGKCDNKQNRNACNGCKKSCNCGK